MVSLRCKMLVDHELDKLDLKHSIVELGEVEVAGKIPAKKYELFKKALQSAGLELMDDKKAVLIEQIKNTVIELIHHSDEPPKSNFSTYLSKKLKRDYRSMATLFSQAKGITIEQYILLHKIERVKELIMYDELTLTEIAWKMHYSSVAHLSSQFKRITGLTPSFFKQLKHKQRLPLEDV